MRLAGIILACILSGVISQSALAANRLSSAESIICKSVKHCIDIVDRHASDEYDYVALHSEFLRFGVKGKSALLKMLSSKDAEDMQRAQEILAKGRFRFTPDEQRNIAALWPRGNLDTHAKIMLGSLSPLMRARAIETLNDKNKTVRTLSRTLIDASVEAEMDFVLKPSDFGALARAALVAPTPGLIELLSTYDPVKTDPIFARILQSGNAPNTMAAYEKLFKDNPEKAFKSLVGTLYALKDNQSETAFAIAALLRSRHMSRPDGFYLKFASDIAQDSEMSAMGRLAGLDAILNYTPKAKDAKLPALPASPLVLKSFNKALDKQGLSRGYIGNSLSSAKDKPDPWLNLIWEHIENDPYASPSLAKELFGFIGRMNSPKAREIVTLSLADKRDFGLINLAIKAAVQQNDKSRISTLKTFYEHPIIDVQATARAAINAFETGKKDISRKTVSDYIATLNTEAKLCRATPNNFQDEVKKLPYFELENVQLELKGPRRNYVSSVHPTKTGWLVGYSAGEWGGDLQFYDNATGNMQGILYPSSSQTDEPFRALDNNVIAIVPVTPQPLGKYASEFWVFMVDGGFSSHAAIYHLSDTKDGFRLKRHAQLPRRRLQITPQKSGEVFISFYDNADKTYISHPPLLLSPNGGLQRACETVPSNNTPSKKASP